MDFGFTLKPESSIERTVALTRQAEAAGFVAGWLFDSHVLWRDPYPLLTLMAQATERLRLGTCVTNPGTLLGPRARLSPGLGQAPLGLAPPALGLAPSPLGLAPSSLLAPPLLVRRN